jgi:hypothetical protein
MKLYKNVTIAVLGFTGFSRSLKGFIASSYKVKND